LSWSAPSVRFVESQSALGANFRSLRRKLGAPKTVTAMAQKLPKLVYRMLKFGQACVDNGAEHYAWPPGRSHGGLHLVLLVFRQVVHHVAQLPHAS
jgi:hypothetical protein